MQEDVRGKKPKNSKVSNKSEIKQSNRNPHWEPPGHSEDLYGSSISLEVGLKDSNHITLYEGQNPRVNGIQQNEGGGGKRWWGAEASPPLITTPDLTLGDGMHIPGLSCSAPTP